ncbi:hypothetical protein GCM10010145_69780 [Streptomyces ruber]|uniref:Uncharacterized protein n=1 Tax=Streptomyces ruber TaxID=83378 RepID=A0A918BT34_9ACTN|nr:hypothetical protein GCM10010145_69780 [Streptomyces ruber]
MSTTWAWISLLEIDMALSSSTPTTMDNYKYKGAFCKQIKIIIVIIGQMAKQP